MDAVGIILEGFWDETEEALDEPYDVAVLGKFLGSIVIGGSIVCVKMSACRNIFIKAFFRGTKSAKKAAKAQFRNKAAGLETKVIRSGRDGTGKILGVGTKGRGGPTYRHKPDGSYIVGKKGNVKHYRPTSEGGHTVNQR